MFHLLTNPLVLFLTVLQTKCAESFYKEGRIFLLKDFVYVVDVWAVTDAMYNLWLTKRSFGIKYTPLAEVAELADALRSGRSSH